MNRPIVTSIEATFRIVTPMFCGGASPETPELRIPSIKGALRFWWRTLQWGRVPDIASLRDREAQLFGSSDGRFGRSKVKMRLIRADLEPVVQKDQILAEGRLRGVHYLGYGLMEAFSNRKKDTRAGQLTRGMIPGGEFTLECRIGRGVTETEVVEVRNALILLGSVGGLGSRSRKGFGSLSLSRLVVNGEPEPLSESVAVRLRESIGDLPARLPDWTAWSTNSRAVVTTHPDASEPWAVLDDLGQEQVYFRSWGHKGQVLSHESERNFRHDHDLMKNGGRPNDFPYRVAFGLPHNYGPKPAMKVAPSARMLDRRASPLLLHVHQPDPERTPIGVATFLPALFLPDEAELQAFQERTRIPTDDDAFWFPIHGWLDRLCDSGNPPPHRHGYDRFSNHEWWHRKMAFTGEEIPFV